MPAYRIYQIDGDGRFAAAEWIQAEDDRRALETARVAMEARPFELWQGNRLVASEKPPQA